jgi:hypothetical protein
MNTSSSKASAQSPCSEIDNETLAARVTARISESPSLAGQNIKISANAGVVTLSGNVSSHSKQRVAARLVRSVTCVKRIVNKLEVTLRIQPFDYICCCDEGCYSSSRPCLQCSAVRHCFVAYDEAMVQSSKALGNKRGGQGYFKSLPRASRDFYQCIANAR